MKDLRKKVMTMRTEIKELTKKHWRLVMWLEFLKITHIMFYVDNGDTSAINQSSIIMYRSGKM